MNIKEFLTQISYDFGMELDDLCFSVILKDFDFPFSFYAFEDDDFLGILVTDENGAEKLHLIVKSEIVYLRIHYIDELHVLFEIDDNDTYRSVNLYE